MLKTVKDTTASIKDMEATFIKLDNKIERFHIHGLISDMQLGKLDALLFDITENVLYNN